MVTSSVGRTCTSVRSRSKNPKALVALVSTLVFFNHGVAFPAETRTSCVDVMACTAVFAVVAPAVLGQVDLPRTIVVFSIDQDSSHAVHAWLALVVFADNHVAYRETIIHVVVVAPVLLVA